MPRPGNERRDAETRRRGEEKEWDPVWNALQVEGTTLVVASGQDRNLSLASRNVPEVELATSDSLNTYQVLRFSKLLFTRSAFEKVEQRLAGEPS